jgi:CheY-like chemotaxis protein
MHIILCSKNSLIIEAAGQAFQARQQRVTVCESGLEVLGAVGVVNADLVIMDMQTPGLNGLLMITAIRELAPNVPIVAVSTAPLTDARAVSHKGISHLTLPSSPHGDAEALMATLTQLAELPGAGMSSPAGSR